MREVEPSTQTVETSDLPPEWSDTIDQVARNKVRIVVEQRGVPVAAIISSEDFERLRRLDAERERAFAVLDRIGAAFADVPAEEIEEHANKALAEVRAENRQAAANAR